MQTGSLFNHLMSNGKTTNPTVGMGVTELCWTDRHAYTVVQILSPKRIVVQRDNARRTDGNGMSDSQDWAYTPDPKGETRTLTLRKDGKWRQEGDSLKGTVFAIGYRAEYYDYSF